MEVKSALNRVTDELAEYLAGSLPRLSDRWWQKLVTRNLTDSQLQWVRGSEGEIEALDLAALIRVFTKNFSELRNAEDLGWDANSFAFQVLDVRNRDAHARAGADDMEDVYRDLDTIERFLRSFRASEGTITEVRKGKHRALQKLAEEISGSAVSTPVVADKPPVVPPAVALSPDQGGAVDSRGGNDNLRKVEALRLVMAETGLTVGTRQSTFANVGEGTDRWWLEPQAKLFEQDLFMVLNHQAARTLYVFKIPAGTYAPADRHFYVRPDNGRVSITIDVGDISAFRDTRTSASSVGFGPYLIASIQY